MEQQKLDNNNTAHKLLDLEKYRLKLKLRAVGVDWHEDKQGKFKIWLRLNSHTAQMQS